MTTLKTADKVKKQAIANIEFLKTEKGWDGFKKIMSTAAAKMDKKERKQFFELMKDKKEKTQFLTYLFSTASIEAALLQQK